MLSKSSGKISLLKYINNANHLQNSFINQNNKNLAFGMFFSNLQYCSKKNFSQLQTDDFNQIISQKLEESKIFQQIYLDGNDLGNIANSMSPLKDYEPSEILSKISYLTPSNIYEQLDILLKSSLDYFATDINMGYGWAIVTISLIIKGFFFPLTLSTQINAQKMKLLQPEMTNYQSLTRKYQQIGDYQNVKKAQKQFMMLREKHGISNILPLLALSQFPVLITWFISLRYITNSPDLYPGITTDGLLWFKDLSAQDPLGLLALLNALLTYYNLSLNPNMQSMAIQSPIAKYMKYIKFFPFFSIPIVYFFPAGLNLYWSVSSAVHLSITLLNRSQTFKNIFGLPQYLPGTILEKLNQNKQQTIFKSVIKDSNIQKKEGQADQQMSKNEANLSNQKVQIFYQKPKKNKQK